MKSFECLAAKKKNRGDQQEQKRNPQRNPAGRSSAHHDGRDPKRATAEKNGEPGARQIQNDRSDKNAEPDQPEDPALSSVAKIVLPAGEERNRRNPEEIGRLVPIRKGTKAALVDPERQTGVRQVKQDADRGQRHDTGREHPKLQARGTKIELLGADKIEPADSGDETDERSRRDPRLRR